MEIEPFTNLIFRVTGSYRSLQSASDTFSLDYYDENGNVTGHISQPEVELSIHYTPGKKVSGFGVERMSLNDGRRSEEHTSELQSRGHLVCRLLLEKKNQYLR